MQWTPSLFTKLNLLLAFFSPIQKRGRARDNLYYSMSIYMFKIFINSTGQNCCSVEFLVLHLFSPVCSISAFWQYISIHAWEGQKCLPLCIQSELEMDVRREHYTRHEQKTSIFTGMSQFCQTPSNKGLLTIIICCADTFFMMKWSVEAGFRGTAVWCQRLWSQLEENLSFH